MWLALRDFYANSWRLVVVNAVLGAVLVLAILATLAEPLAIVFVVATGPVVAALVHCAVTLVRTGDLTLADAVDGLRLHWRAGSPALRRRSHPRAPWACSRSVSTAGLPSGRSPSSRSTSSCCSRSSGSSCGRSRSPHRTGRSGAVVRESASVTAARPGQTLVLGLALLLLNVAGIAAAVMPFLTLTVAYTFLVTARFLVTPEEEAA